MNAIEVLPNRLVEVSHEMCLVQRSEMFLHQLPKLGTHGAHGESMSADVGEGNARDDAAGADGDVMHVTTDVAGLEDP
jgi:hypothetical protein